MKGRSDGEGNQSVFNIYVISGREYQVITGIRKFKALSQLNIIWAQPVLLSFYVTHEYVSRMHIQRRSS